MATSTLEVVIRGRDLLSGTLNKVSGELNTLKGSADGLKGSILAGVGLGAGVAGFGLLTEAIQRGVGVMQDAVAAAMEDERSVKQLSVALTDAIPGWDGQTTAIERTIRARQDLGFEDTALRGSLATLASVTHDTTHALDLQALSMDIARFRGIDLASASDMVAKAASGSMKALNAAIPATKGAASAQEALAIAMKATAGQADAYATTTVGKMEAANVRIGESTEKLGYIVLPVLAEALGLVAGSVDLLATAASGALVPLKVLDSDFMATTPHIDAAAVATSSYTTYVSGLVAPAAAAASATHRVGVETKYAAINAASAIPRTDGYTGALGRLASKAVIANERLRELNGTLGWTGGLSVNAATGFLVTQEQQNQAIIDATNAHQDYLQSQLKAAEATTQKSSAVRDNTAATRDQISAEDAIIERLKTEGGYVTALTDAYRALTGHRMGQATPSGTEAHAKATGPDAGAASPDLTYVNGKPVYKMPSAPGSGQTTHEWSANGATNGSAGMGGGTYDNGSGVPIVIALDGRVIAEVVDTYLARRA